MYYPRIGLTVDQGGYGYGPGLDYVPGGGAGAGMYASPIPMTQQSYGSQGGYVPQGGGGALLPIPTAVHASAPLPSYAPPVSSYGSQGVPSGGAGAAMPFVPKGIPPVSSYGGGAAPSPAGGAGAPGGGQPGLRSYGGGGFPGGGAPGAGPGGQPGLRSYGGGAFAPPGAISPIAPPAPYPVWAPYGWGNPFFNDCTPEVAFGACSASTGCMQPSTGCSSCGTSIGAMSETGTIITTGIAQAEAQKQLSDEDGRGVYSAAKATAGGKHSWLIDVGIASAAGLVAGYLLGKAYG